MALILGSPPTNMSTPDRLVRSMKAPHQPIDELRRVCASQPGVMIQVRCAIISSSARNSTRHLWFSLRMSRERCLGVDSYPYRDERPRDLTTHIMNYHHDERWAPACRLRFRNLARLLAGNRSTTGSLLSSESGAKWRSP